MKNQTEKDIKRSLLLYEAKRWVGTQEEGKNGGQIIKMFQKAVDGKAQGEPWCMGFAMSSVIFADNCFLDCFREGSSTKLFKSEHCLTVWNKSPSDCKIEKPEPGSIGIYQFVGTPLGHCCIVTKVINDASFETIEGNTSAAQIIEREGEGVFVKTRSLSGSKRMSLLGFLRPWG